MLSYTTGFISGCLLDKQRSIFQVMASNYMVWVASFWKWFDYISLWLVLTFSRRGPDNLIYLRLVLQQMYLVI